MTSAIVGVRATREHPFRIDIKKTPSDFYRLCRLRTKDIHKEKGLYGVYCRLCHLQKLPNNPWKQKNRQLLSPVDVNVSGHSKTNVTDSLRCRCDEHSMDVLRQLYDESPENRIERTLPSRFIQDRFMNEVLSNFLINETAQMPLSTLVIRWRLGRNIPNYEKQDLIGLLSCYGHVHAVYKQSPNSAIVIFNDIDSACRVMQAKHLGEPRNKIHCSWFHKFMSNKAFYSSSHGFKVRSDPFIHMHNKTLIKRYS